MYLFILLYNLDNAYVSTPEKETLKLLFFVVQRKVTWSVWAHRKQVNLELLQATGEKGGMKYPLYSSQIFLGLCFSSRGRQMSWKMFSLANFSCGEKSGVWFHLHLMRVSGLIRSLCVSFLNTVLSLCFQRSYGWNRVSAQCVLYFSRPAIVIKCCYALPSNFTTNLHSVPFRQPCVISFLFLSF